MMRRTYGIDDKPLEKKTIDEVITRIEEIDGDAVGVIAAQDVIDIVTQNLGPAIYEMGVEDAKKLIRNRAADLENDLDMLVQ